MSIGQSLMGRPLAVFVIAFVVMWLAALLGAALQGKQSNLPRESREDFGVVLAAALTLLGLIIGFSFSMAVSRYDLRKTYEEAEANAIGTEYARADLLDPEAAAKVRADLLRYIDLRITFYNERRDLPALEKIKAQTAQLQGELWTTAQTAASAKPTPISALAVAGMNDVLNSQGYTQAAWWNRIPIAAWGLMAAIAICCNMMIGFGARHAASERLLLLVLPLLVAISFFLIADIDSPRGGMIKVHPQNLQDLSQSIRNP
jgi:hypothetical protein